MIFKITFPITIKRVAFKFHPFFILLFFVSSTCLAEFTFTPKCENALQNFLSLKIDKGQKLLNESLKEKPQNGISIYLANYSDA